MLLDRLWRCEYNNCPQEWLQVVFVCVQTDSVCQSTEQSKKGRTKGRTKDRMDACLRG